MIMDGDKVKEGIHNDRRLSGEMRSIANLDAQGKEELIKQSAILRTKQADLQTVQEQLSRISEEGTQIIAEQNVLYLYQSRPMSKEMAEIKKEIEVVLPEVIDKRKLIAKCKEKLSTQERKFSEDMLQMETFKAKVLENENTTDGTVAKLRQIQEELKLLYEQRSILQQSLTAHESETCELTNDAAKLKSTHSATLKELEKQDKQNLEIKKVIAKMEQELTVLKKRNAARLRRLKSQVKEAQYRYTFGNAK